ADWFSSTNVASITVTDCSEDEDTVFSGAFDETGLTVFAGESVISFYDLYSLDGVQYAVGLMEDEDKKTSPVYMMR
nr:hypothetical protein [Lachnospiraceae bacterium]